MRHITYECSTVGLARGIVQATRDAVLQVLEVRFGKTPIALTTAMTQIENLSRLKILLQQAAVVASLEEFEELLS